jgi:Protein-L-isoaspartate(D-aspartate) O-methyltransferase (PCMT)
MINFKLIIFFFFTTSLITTAMFSKHTIAQHTQEKLNKLVEHLIATGVVKNPKVNAVMRKVDRGEFCSGFGNRPYEDSP